MAGYLISGYQLQGVEEAVCEDVLPKERMRKKVRGRERGGEDFPMVA